ncbi:hypothetical protein [Streptomyces sp. AS02]|uniref:hypothetical protein n=1 Tax=Streptomyces sp. AS02 TaxID=2938946 RepID=UPI00201FE65C|nr:hypothetical protein [Streptomyces sp. AS02]MCL8016923.1 hypothetical protein [Streptomyces sp. AS02]
MTTELTQEQRDRRAKQARTAIQNALAASWTEWRRTGRRPDFTKAADHAMDGLGDLAAEILVDGTMLKALTVKDGVVTVELAEAHWYLKLYVASMRAVLDDTGAENYAEIYYETAPSVSMDLRDGDNAEVDNYTLTLQRRTKPTPHEFRQRAEARVAAVLAECDAIEQEVYGQHDEDDDGMREAVRRIRAAATEAGRA